jgi:hypothetical protein
MNKEPTQEQMLGRGADMSRIAVINYSVNPIKGRGYTEFRTSPPPTPKLC